MGVRLLQDRVVRRLVAWQHGVVSRAQLLALGYSPKAIDHSRRTGALHRLWRGVFAVGRPEIPREGRWAAALLACGPTAVLSHGSAAAFWRLGELEGDTIEISVPPHRARRRGGIHIYRRVLEDRDIAVRGSIRVTSPARTLIDLVPRLTPRQCERMINEAANLDLLSPSTLREELERRAGRRGVPVLRRMLDRRTFRLTRSELERRFLPIARRAGLGTPETRVWLDGFEVDFYFRDLDLVVETDGLRYHRTPAQQARDRLRDQAHTAAGRTPLRFTHEQIRFHAPYVENLLRTVHRRLLPPG